MKKGNSNQHRLLYKRLSNHHIQHIQHGGNAIDDWNNALETSSAQFANSAIAQLEPFIRQAQHNGMSNAELKQIIDNIGRGAKDYAWKQLENKYPRPGKFSSFIGTILGGLNSIPGLSLIPIVKEIETGIGGILAGATALGI